MRSNSFYPVFKLSFLFAVIGLAAVFIFELVAKNKNLAAVDSEYNRLIWIASGLAVFFTMIFFVRVTQVNWTLSILAGVLTTVIYFLFVNFLFYLLTIFIRGFLWG